MCQNEANCYLFRPSRLLAHFILPRFLDAENGHRPLVMTISIKSTVESRPNSASITSGEFTPPLA